MSKPMRVKATSRLFQAVVTVSSPEASLTALASASPSLSTNPRVVSNLASSGPRATTLEIVKPSSLQKRSTLPAWAAAISPSSQVTSLTLASRQARPSSAAQRTIDKMASRKALAVISSTPSKARTHGVGNVAVAVWSLAATARPAAAPASVLAPTVAWSDRMFRSLTCMSENVRANLLARKPPYFSSRFSEASPGQGDRQDREREGPTVAGRRSRRGAAARTLPGRCWPGDQARRWKLAKALLSSKTTTSGATAQATTGSSSGASSAIAVAQAVAIAAANAKAKTSGSCCRNSRAFSSRDTWPSTNAAAKNGRSHGRA
mmetsp:Transcript_38687/g.90413  ORF Transcript_38687/g.90413 Transcript_38687/m.90413 type:complete len:319 (-) Transcript_38687:188-1144(-)